MYCGKCGTRIPDDSRFCPSCGVPIFSAPEPTSASEPTAEPLTIPVSEPVPGPPVKAKKKLSTGALIGIIAGGVAALALAAVLLVLLRGGRSWKQTIEKALHADANYDLAEMIEVCVPDDILEYKLKENNISRPEFNAMLREVQAEITEENKDSDTLTYEILGTEPAEDYILESLNEMYMTYYGTEYGYISDAMFVNFRFSYGSHSGGGYATLVKIGRDWYLSLDDFDPLEEIF